MIERKVLCDRCRRVLVEELNRQKQKERDFRIVRTRDGYDEGDVDLCNDCYKRFKSFMTSRNQEIEDSMEALRVGSKSFWPWGKSKKKNH